MALPVALLEESFDLVAPRGPELIERFYHRVFAIAPGARALFADADMAKQQRMLLRALILLRESLRNLETIVPILRALGARHEGYGVLPEHYPVVGEALLGAMAEIGGTRWLPDHTAAWTAAFQVVQETMLSGATSATPA